jgi:tetratricopeptide (TPR) repeat protein
MAKVFLVCRRPRSLGTGLSTEPSNAKPLLLLGAAILLAAALAPSIILADTLYLTNGRTIEVDRYWEEGNQIYYERNGGVFGFPRSLLERVVRGAPGGPASKKQPESKQSETSGFRNEPYAQAIEKARESATEGDLEEASRQYRKALGAAPNSVTGRVELAELYIQRGDFMAAQTQLEQAKRVAPEESTVRELLGEVYYRRGRTALAIREWQKALELDPRADLVDKLKQALRENDQDIEFDELQRPHFLIRYDGAVNETIGREVAVALEREHQELVQEFHFTPQAPVTVTLYTNREFNDVTHAPSWASAINDGEIRIPVEGLTALTPKVHDVLRHELTHTFVNARTGNNCPTWFHEGLAQLRVGATPAGMYQQLSEARENGTLLPLWSLEGPVLSYSSEQARLAYLESLAATEYLVTRKGRHALSRILDLLARGQTMNDALTRVIGLDYQELQIAWEADLGRYRPGAR